MARNDGSGATGADTGPKPRRVTHAAAEICAAEMMIPEPSQEIAVAVVAFEYNATFIPYRARNTVREKLNGSDVVLIPRPLSGIRNAFRVHHPHATYERVQDYDILEFRGNLYWPLCLNNYDWQGHLSEQDCLTELKAGNWNLLSTFADIRGNSTIPRPMRTADDLAGVRDFSSGQRDRIVAMARRRAAENLLLHDGHAWVRGGEPVYLNRSSWRYMANVVNPGADRSATPQIDWLNEAPAFYAEGQEPIRNGEFFTADRHADAEAAARQHGTHAPEIEVSMPEMLRLVPARARLDAIFRLTTRFSHWILGADAAMDADAGLFPMAAKIVATDQIGDDGIVDTARIRALKPLRDYCEKKHFPNGPHEFSMLHWDLRRFWQQERAFIRKANRRRYLAPIDDAMLHVIAEQDHSGDFSNV